MTGTRDRIMSSRHKTPRVKTFHVVKRRLPAGFYLTFVSWPLRIRLIARHFTCRQCVALEVDNGII